MTARAGPTDGPDDQRHEAPRRAKLADARMTWGTGPKDNTVKTYEPMCGDRIETACERLVALTADDSAPAQMTFNGVTIIAQPGDDPSVLVTRIQEEMRVRYEAYLASPEAAAAKAGKVRAAEAVAALVDAPAVMSLRDPVAWQKALEVNKDDYGACALRYAERWARMMEAAISRGETLAECAERLSYVADTEGITGYMQGAATTILSHVWQHGDGLRAALGK